MAPPAICHNYCMEQDSDAPAEEGFRVLLADDSPVERMALAHYLRRHGYAVDEVGDGESALNHLKNREIDPAGLPGAVPL